MRTYGKWTNKHWVVLCFEDSDLEIEEVEVSRGGFRVRFQGDFLGRAFRGRSQGEASGGGLRGRIQEEVSGGGSRRRFQGEVSRGGFRGRFQEEVSEPNKIGDLPWWRIHQSDLYQPPSHWWWYCHQLYDDQMCLQQLFLPSHNLQPLEVSVLDI